jgi:hypothetical protein
MPIGRAPKEHDLKTWPEFFRHVWTGDKSFEMRENDRDFQAGDTLLLREWSKEKGYSGRSIRAEVTYLLGGRWPGLEKGYVVMAIALRGREGT